MADGGLESIVRPCDSPFPKDPEETVPPNTESLAALFARRLEEAIEEDGKGLTLSDLEKRFGSLF